MYLGHIDKRVYTMKILDLNFFSPKVIASYLLESSEGPVLIETGPDTTYKTLISRLKENGYQPEDVKHVFVTHIHLDHSGAAWHFAKNGSTVYVHPRGSKHLIDPEKLLASAKMIYKDQMDELWGNVEGIDENRVVSLNDGEVVKIGDLSVKAIETPGHASHHNAYLVGDDLFCGDVAGNRIETEVILPPTPPPDINIEKWKESISRIREISPRAIYPTHFGRYTDVEAHLTRLENTLDSFTEWMGERVKAGKSDEEIVPEFESYTYDILNEHNISKELVRAYELSDPFWMNVYGLTRYWRKFRLSEG